MDKESNTNKKSRKVRKKISAMKKSATGFFSLDADDDPHCDELNKGKKNSSLSYGVQQKFDAYREEFLNMTKRMYIETGVDIESIMITYDSLHAVTISFKSD